MIVPSPTGKARISALDALRGFALLGILIANLPIFSGWQFLSTQARLALPTAAIDRWVEAALVILVQGKFYSLFALLFGIGLALALGQGRPEDVARVRRRLLALLAIGGLHLLVWAGDILVLYAVCGLVALLLHRWSCRALVWSAVMLLMLPVGQYALAWITGGQIHLANLGFAALAWVDAHSLPAARDMAAYTSGDLLAMLNRNALAALERWVMLIWEGRVFKVLGLFAFGLVLGRRIRAQGVVMPSDTQRWLVVIAPLALAANVAFWWSHDQLSPGNHNALGFVAVTAYALGVVPLTVCYAIVFIYIFQCFERTFEILVYAGRVSLSLYLMQTFVGIALFMLVAFGWVPSLGPAATTVLAILAFTALAWVARRWLQRFPMGPAEWLLKRWSAPVP